HSSRPRRSGAGESRRRRLARRTAGPHSRRDSRASLAGRIGPPPSGPAAGENQIDPRRQGFEALAEALLGGAQISATWQGGRRLGQAAMLVMERIEPIGEALRGLLLALPGGGQFRLLPFNGRRSPFKAIGELQDKGRSAQRRGGEAGRQPFDQSPGRV